MAFNTERLNVIQLVTLILVIGGAVYLGAMHAISGDATVAILSSAMSAAFLNQRFALKQNGDIAKIIATNGSSS